MADTFSLPGQLADFVSIDLETTGVDSQNDEIIELGAVRFTGGREVARYSQLVKPRRKRLPEEIVELTGITDDDLHSAPSLNSVAREFIRFVGDSPILGKNVAFDLAFLAAATPTATHFIKARTAPITHDAGLVAKFIYPCLDSHSLAALAALFDTPTKPCHRGVDDAAATGELLIILVAHLMRVDPKERENALRILETTSSPLRNTLEAIENVGEAGTDPNSQPSPFWRSTAGRDNYFTAPGDDKPKEAVPEELLRRLFSDRSRFEKILPAYEIRPQQVEMAALVARAFKDGNVLAIEAGTGVGKSLGYLAPALLSGSRVAISTHTKNLQDQLFYDEIPRLGRLFRFGFTAALMKGRRNYLCRTKWREILLDPERLPMADRERAALLVRWVEKTKSGDLSEVTAIRSEEGEGFWRYVASEPGFCTTKTCAGQECPLARIRKAASKADLVIVNHSLVLSDLASDGALLGDMSKVVFDEAHHLESVATDHYGSDVSQPGVKSAIERAGALTRPKGELIPIIAMLPMRDALLITVGEIQAASSAALSEIEPFFSAIRHLLKDIKSDKNYSTSLRYDKGDLLHGSIAAAGSSLAELVSRLARHINRLAERLTPFEDLQVPGHILQNVRNVASEIAEVADGLRMAVDSDKPNRVYWVEIPAWANMPVRLKSAPLDVAEMLSEGLFSRLQSTLLTSATLTTGSGPGAFSHLTRRLGLTLLPGDRVQTMAFGSPFDYQKHCLVLSPSYLPHPSETPADHSLAVAETCAMLAKKFKRGMLILLTSYESLRRTENELKRLLTGFDIEILVQSGRSDRDRLVRRFRGSNGGILLGTDSLWEGIDVPGAALEIVVIAKLPFDVPGDPVVAARIDKIRNEGGNPFFDYQLPAAILRTRQGAGRLIRTATDRGIVLLLDPRVVTKGYGRQVRKALPGREAIPSSSVEIEKMVSEFFTEAV